MTCAQCHYTVLKEEPVRFCPACGAQWTTSNWRRIYHIGLPLLSAAASFVPWVRVGLGSRLSLWTVYHVSPWAWAWLSVDLMVMVVSGWPRLGMTYYIVRLWQLLGAATLAVGLSVLVSVGMAKKVSAILGAPSPVHLFAGLPLFVGIVAVWTIFAAME